jgi:hypothetical protein
LCQINPKLFARNLIRRTTFRLNACSKVYKRGYGYILRVSLGVTMPLFVTNGSTVMEITGTQNAE